MFPHTITIYRHWVEDETDRYDRLVVSGVYWHGSTGAAASGKGAEKQNGCTVYASPETTAAFGLAWSVQAGDRIVFGTGPEIGSLADIVDGFTVKKVDCAICGSPLDNITITGE